MQKKISMIALSPLMEELLAQGKSVELTVTGNSMRPLLMNRISQVRLVSAGTLRRGQIPLYRRDSGEFVLHRIVALEEASFTCCGDAQWHLETGVRPQQVIGVVTSFSRKGGRWISCKNPLYGLYWRIWLMIRPIRWLVTAALQRGRAMRGR